MLKLENWRLQMTLKLLFIFSKDTEEKDMQIKSENTNSNITSGNASYLIRIVFISLLLEFCSHLFEMMRVSGIILLLVIEPILVVMKKNLKGGV